ncbi:MAG: hypothetical protein IPP88_12295 [Betaproteobacteria bacterium]|nr:hypothetical protein [Betaproteobacteria bacterium]
MNLDVLIPSLFLPAQIHTQFPPPAVPALERLLARADRQVEGATGASSWLFQRWGVGAPYAIAPLLAEHDGLDASNDGWMFAEPVHLIADRHRLKMFPAGFLEVSAAETAELISTLNVHFADRGLEFHAPVPASLPRRWYVRCPPSEIPATTSPEAARSGSLADFQPTSTGTLNWRSLQNEAQMLFFGHPVNEAREEAGKPTISGVWFWGGGARPTIRKPSFESVVANSALAMALAKKLASACCPCRGTLFSLQRETCSRSLNPVANVRAMQIFPNGRANWNDSIANGFCLFPKPSPRAPSDA